jgi:O-antigen ligase
MILFFAVNVGILGIMLYLITYLIVVKTAYRNYKVIRKEYFKGLSLGVYIVVIISFIIGLVETNFIGVALGWFIGFIMGICFSIYNLSRERSVI